MTNPDSEKEILERIQEEEAKWKKDPKDFLAMYRHALLLNQTKEYKEAAKILYRLAKLGPEEDHVYREAGLTLTRAGRLDDAVEVLLLGLDKFPLKEDLLGQLSNALLTKKDYKNAVELLQIAKEKAPRNMSVYVALIVAYTRAGMFEEAAQAFNEGVEIDDSYAPIYNAIGALYVSLKRFEEASAYLMKAARLDPTNPSVLVNLAVSFDQMKHTDMALKFYDQAINVAPENENIISAKANLMCMLGFSQEALPLYRECIDKIGADESMKEFNYKIHLSNFIFYSHYSPEVSRQEIYEVIQLWQKELCKNIIDKPRELFENKAKKEKKLRVGLLSGSFMVHPVGQMIYEALANTDLKKIEYYCYSDMPPERKDYLTEKLFKACKKIEKIFGKTNEEICDIIRDDEIDILIEMTGHSEGGRRLSVAAMRAAPVQVKWVGGLFNTTGLPQMDWIIGDNVEIPKGEEKWYTEKIYRMPDDYVVYHPPFYAPKVKGLPALKNGYITFGNMNNLAKTNTYTLELWAKLLKAVPKSKLLFKGRKFDTPYVMKYLEEFFATHNIGIDRIMIEGGEKHQAFMDVYNRIDIAVDPHPYSGGLTTCEALWMGVPVINLPGETFAGRHAATHLTTAGMEDWIAKDEEDYIAIAKKWANDLDALSELRNGLRDKVAASPLVDGPRFAKNLESALRHMWSEWCDEKLGHTKNGKKAVIKPPKPKKSKKKKK